MIIENLLSLHILNLHTKGVSHTLDSLLTMLLLQPLPLGPSWPVSHGVEHLKQGVTHVGDVPAGSRQVEWIGAPHGVKGRTPRVHGLP
jgi:hypothetical protein